MTLSPIIKSDDPEFNHEAAQFAADLVMKMDADEARLFTSFIVGDLLEETIEKNRRTLQRHLDEVVHKQIDGAKRATMRLVSKNRDPEAVEFAKSLEQLEDIVKANPHRNPYTDYGYKFQESNFRRDPGSGRFQRKITPQLSRPLDTKTRDAMGIPQKGPARGANALSPEEQARFQSEYMQLADFLGAVNQSVPESGFANVMLHIKDNRGNTYVKHQTGTAPDHTAWNPKTEELVGVEALPSDLTVGGAAFSLANSLGAGEHTGHKVAYTANQAEAGFNDFGTQWYQAGSASPRNSNERTYGRVKAGSEFLGRVAPNGSQLQVAAKFGSIIGSHGAEAESVFGPLARRTAYRYRGTERKPDDELLFEYDKAVRLENADRVSDPEERKRRDAAVRRAYLAERKKMAGEYNKDKPFGQQKDFNAFVIPDERKKEIARSFQMVREERPVNWANGRQKVAEYLRAKMPDPGLYALHLDAGNTPPSEGVLIDRHGQIKAQAIGYGDDHYLPFNLRNLKDLKGGEYIRNRSVGGPTSEDIYTGLVGGAKRIEVVSRSGNFTVEFEDDFRGGRRHNDKARRMVRRYEQILDSVQSETVQRQTVQKDVVDAFKRQAMERYPAWSPKQRADYVKQQTDEYKANPEMNSEQMDAFEGFIRRQTEGMSEAQALNFRKDAERSWAAEKEYNFRLNGEGYAAALDALAEQFPYYIKAHHETTKEHEIELERDKGYVEPGRNRPTAARAGWHGTKGVNQSEKFSASQADYQRGRNGTAGGTAPVSFRLTPVTPPSDPGATPGANGAAAPAAPGTPAPGAVNGGSQAARIQYSVAATRALDELTTGRQVGPDTRNVYRFLQPANTPGFRARLEAGEPAATQEFYDFVNATARDLVSNNLISQETLSAYTRAAGHVDRQPYDPALKFTVPPKPMAFGGPEYEENADRTLVEDKARAIAQGINPVSTGKSANEMNDAEIKREIERVQFITQMAQAQAAEPNLAQRDANLQIVGINTQDPAVARLIDPDSGARNVDSHLEAMHRLRALNLNRENTIAGMIGGSLRPQQTVTNVVHPTPAITAGSPEPDHVREIQDRAKVFRQAAKRLRATGRPTQATLFDTYVAGMEQDLADPTALTPQMAQIHTEETESHYPRASTLAAEQDAEDRRRGGS